MLDVILGLVALFCGLSLVIGLFDPEQVLPLGKRATRPLAASVYLVLTCLFLSLAWVATDKKDSIRAYVLGSPEVALNGPQPLDPADAGPEFDAWCQYRQGLAANERLASERYSVDPRASWQQGDVVTLEKDTRLAPAMPDAYASDEEMERAASKIVVLKRGEKVQVLARLTSAKDGRLWYQIEVVGRKSRGYMGEHVLFWYDTPARRAKLVEDRAAFLAGGEENLKRDLFQARGLDFMAVSEKAALKRWNGQCDGPKGIDLR